MEKTKTPETVDAYIAQFPLEVQHRLNQIRALIHREIPEASERIAYRMPTFYLNGYLIHFAAFEHHIGVYPLPDAVEAFQKDLAPYKQGKGSVQFPLDQPLPLELIRRIVLYRLDNLAKSQPTKAQVKKPTVKGR